MKLTDSDLKLSSKNNSSTNMQNIELTSDMIRNDSIKEKALLNEKQDFEDPLVKNSKVAPQRFSSLLRQSVAVSGPLLATVCSGLTTGYSAILLPQLKHENSTIPITEDEGSWIASMAALPMAFGCLIGGALMDRFGRKIAQILICINFFIGWCLLSTATSIIYLLIGRFVTGLSTGALGAPASVYIAECTSPKYRGLFLAMISFSISLGILIAHIIGTFFSWQLTAIICATVPCMCIAILYFAPESPSYLASKNKFQIAENSFLWLRGHSMEAKEELDELINKYKRQVSHVELTKKQEAQVTSSSSNNKLTFFQQLTKFYFWKPFLIMNLFFAITQWSGVNAVAFYSVNIIQDTLGDNFNSYLAMAIIDITRLIMSVIACVLLKKYPRRFLAIISSILTAIILIFLSVFIYFVDIKKTAGFEYIPLVSLVLYICFISVGLVPLPWVMIGEVFPSAVRSAGTGLTSCMCFVYFFLVVKTAPYLFFRLGSAQAYGIYGLVALLGCFVLYVFLPETKDKTLEDIETKMKGRKKRNDV